jgi:hypothetical protein
MLPSALSAKNILGREGRIDCGFSILLSNGFAINVQANATQYFLWPNWRRFL